MASTLPHPTATGEALDPRLYTDPAVLQAEQRLIFEHTWQLAGHISALREAGSYITCRAGNQPVLVVRDDKGELRAYRNICRHRASRLLSGSGQCKGAIRCRYHGWTYRFDGTLIGVPEALAYGERLDKSALPLLPARVEEMCGLVFINLDMRAAPLAELVGDLPQRLAPYRIETLESFAHSTDIQPANWKVLAENYLEGYHVPIAHPGLMRLYDYKRYLTDTHEHYAWFDAPLRDKPSSNRLERLYWELVEPMPGVGEERRRRVELHPHLSEHDDRPLPRSGHHLAADAGRGRRDRGVYDCYRPPGSGPRTRLVQWANHRLNTLVTDEDTDLVSNVQQGAQTRDYTCGPLSPREGGVAWFGDRIRADLAAKLDSGT